MDTVEGPPISGRRPKHLEIEAAAATRTGRRCTNADALLLDEAAGLFAVGDGMGDSPRSGLVAHMALEAVRELFQAPWTLIPRCERSVDEAIERMILGLAQAHGRLYAPVRAPADRVRTTFAGVVVCGDALCFGAVGDSRAYLLCRREERVVQVKEDDTVLGDAVLRGVPREAAARLPNAHALTRMLGAHPGLAAVPLVRRWARGDIALLCTDGVSDQVEPDVLASLLLDAGEPGEAASRIVERALRTGGDNATAVVVRRAC